MHRRPPNCRRPPLPLGCTGARAQALPCAAALLLLAGLVLLGPAAPQRAVAADVSASARVFAEAMARMMDAMGLLGDDGAPAVPPPAAGAMPGVGAPFGMGALPWSGMADSGMPDMGAWMQQMPGMVRLPDVPGWRRTSLDGIWEGRDGGLLIVQAHRFRLYAPHGDYIEGLIQQRGDRVAMYDPEHDLARPYEFAQHQGRLVLRDPAGQVYLYRRLWHDDIGYGAGADMGAGQR
ncbi:hypothetical protein [uncultured Thiohalocapsa sp.]|jgi:hypothetical protein|uniref:hypothetical protein n=1 Tax=uncultured Thiohalocapsa sp. TaxID=768990 RepID=UPI0025F794EB|nr:hypothetical protein [uncultured Thiohalocapsa sp.]